MSLTDRKRSVALILSTVPGWGHVYWGRERLGLSLFTAAAVSGFALLNGLFIYQGEGQAILTWASGTLLGALWIAAWLELFLRTGRKRQRRDREARARLLDRGTVAYLRGEFEESLRSFRECLRIEPLDVEALFRLGIVAGQSGDLRQARRWLRRTLRYDLEGKWTWEVERALERLGQEERRSPKGAARRETEQTPA